MKNQFLKRYVYYYSIVLFAFLIIFSENAYAEYTLINEKNAVSKARVVKECGVLMLMKKLTVQVNMLMAIRQRKPPANLIIHSDRGSQYCSKTIKT